MWPSGGGNRAPCSRDSAVRRAAFSGHLSALPPHLVPTGRCVRLFISADPEDTEAERNALRDQVYPKLREFCRENYGMEFQAIDLYWGVPMEEWDSPELQRTRMRLLEECLKTSAGPCFVGNPVQPKSSSRDNFQKDEPTTTKLNGLLGEKYGTIRIPGEVESSEFEMILDAAIEAKLETRTLEEWYCRDENAVPAAYYLRPKADMLRSHNNPGNPAQPKNPLRDQFQKDEPTTTSWVDSSTNSAIEKKWREVAEEIKNIFKISVKLLHEKGKLRDSQAKRYLSSALEDEFDFALGKQTAAFLKKCVCYIRKISNIEKHVKIPEMSRYTDVIKIDNKMMRDPEAMEKMIKLRDEFIPTIVASSNLRVYTSVTHCDMKLGYSQEVENHYVDGLCKQFYEDMIDIIQATVQQNFETETDSLYDEILQHLSLCRTYSSLYEYRCEALSLVHRYIQPSKSGHVNPLIVYGGPCTGKTLLLAEVAKKAFTWLQEEMGPDSDPVVIVRFLGSTEMSSDLNSLLLSLCKQMAANFKCLLQNIPKKILDLRELFLNLLNESSFHRPLILVLDSLEQISDIEDARKLWWLPVHLPRTVRIILSTLPNKHGILQKLRCLIHNEDNYIELIPRDRKMCSQILKHQLLRVKRKVTSGQQIYVNEAFSRCTLPMFVNLTFREVRNWRSHKDVDDSTLCITVHENIEQLFCSLENKCGPRLVSRALGYITMAKTGISEVELEDILALDNSVMNELITSGTDLNPLRVPYQIIAQIREDLTGYLVERHVRNVILLVWSSRHLHLIAQKLYLHNDDDLQEMHANMAEYFLGMWSGGRKKPFYSEHQYFENCLQNEHRDSPLDGRFNQETEFDRQAPEQPWAFQCNPLQPDIFFVNHRKMTELLFHLTRCGMTDEMMSGITMNFSWLYTMIKIGQFERALSDIEIAYNYSQEKELKFLASTLQNIKNKVLKTPGSLSAELQQILLPVVSSLPKFRNLLIECDKDGPKYCSIVPLHSSMDVTYTPERISLSTSSLHVTEVLPTYNPNIIISALENGTISTWDVESRQLLRQITTTQFVIMGMKLTADEKYLVVSTTKNTLLVYDNLNSCLLSEVEIKGSKGVGGGPNLINGFTLSHTHALAWLEASKNVNVIDLLYGWPLYNFHCWYEVTCIQCSSDGLYAFCGQYLNTTTIFHLGTGEKLSTVTSEFSGGFVKYILVLDTTQEVVMIDNEGSLSVWNAEEMTNPQLAEEFDCTKGDSEVISTELSEDQSAILICKAFSIELLDTRMWKVSEKFRAKRHERFISAILSRNSDCIIASMENTSSIFVWRRDSGQCMASLQEISGNIVKLVKSNHHNLLLSLSVSGVLSIWDTDILTAMSNIDKTGRPVQTVLLSGRGDYIYSLDGSEYVQKWNFNTGYIESAFKHEGIVEYGVLTATGELLVTSDDKCNQYVWHTATGENILRISGQRISQLLITHNDQFIVSLCEQNASRVWRLATGHKVCNILAALKNALITTANTFLIGMAKNKLLAVSLWTGSITKKYCCDDGTTIVNFNLIPDCPDFVVFMTSTETVNIWSLAEEAICRRVQLPCNFLKNLNDFEISPNGKLGIITHGDEKFNVLDLQSGKLRVVHASGIIWKKSLSCDGRYLVYICFRNVDDDEDNSVSSLIVMRLADGKSIGACSLYKTPTFLALSQRHLNIVVGFEDGSIGTYTVVDRVDAQLKIKIATSNSRQIFNNKSHIFRPKCNNYIYKMVPDCLWRESTEVFARDSPITVSDSVDATETTPTKKHNFCYEKMCSAIDCRGQSFAANN